METRKPKPHICDEFELEEVLEAFKRADLVLGFVVTLAVSLSCYGNWNLYLWVYRFCSVQLGDRHVAWPLTSSSHYVSG